MAANFKWLTLGDIAHAGWELGIICRCGRQATLNAKLLDKVFGDRGWDTKKHMIAERLRCTRCGKHPYRIGISANKPDPPARGPMRLRNLREQGMRNVRVDCNCYPRPDIVNVDHLPGKMPVPDVRFHIGCPACGARPLRVIPDWPDVFEGKGRT